MLLLGGTSCKKENKNEDVFSYDDLYKSVYKEPFNLNDNKSSKPLYGFTKNTYQGFNNWYFLYDDLKEMNFDKNKGAFVGNNNILKENEITLKGKVTLKYIAEFSGESFIYGFVKHDKNSKKSADLKVYLKNNVVFTKTISNVETDGIYFESSKFNLNVNDEILIEISSEDALIHFEPVITSNSSNNESLYHLNDFNEQYGDVFPWYNEEEHTLYMRYLYSPDATNGDFYNQIDLSTNLVRMKTYPEAGNYEIWEKQRQNYDLNFVFDCNRFIDRTEYTYGIRDCMLYRDKENGRFLLIGGCYRTFSGPIWDSDLMIYASDDDMALSWSKPGVPVETNIKSHLPECPSLLKIGDRWYTFVSMSHITTHQIGALQYRIGDKDKDCLDVNWMNKDVYYLDGEDLCAARPTKVGDKTYMWGWITASYDGVPMKPWAGYLNLPREVVQRSDGSLGGRMNPGLEKFLNYGKLVDTPKIELTSNNMTIVRNNNYRNLVKFNASLKNTNEVSYCIVQNKKLYKVSLIKENNEVLMQISSPDDSKHKINSTLKVHSPSTDDNYEIKIVIDGRIIEFFVNDDNALSASTSMIKTDAYDSYLLSSGDTSISNFKIYRLRSYYDCE